MVKLFTFSIWIGDDEYQGQIPARTWTEAAELVDEIGGEVDGLVVEEGSICDMCGDAIVDAIGGEDETYFYTDGNYTNH